jgi:multidrug resistance efflux pump
VAPAGETVVDCPGGRDADNAGMRAWVIALVVIVAALAAAQVYSQRRSEPLKVSGVIEADEIRVGSRVGGRVKSVNAAEGRSVHAGELLLELDPYDLLQRKAQAAAQAQVKRAELDRLKAGFRPEEIAQAEARREQAAAKLEELVNGPRPEEIAAAEARLRQADATRQSAETTFNRINEAFQRNAASPDELSTATEQFKVATAAFEARQAELKLLKAGTRSEEIAAARANLHEAEQSVKLMKAGYRKEEIAAAQAAVDAADAELAIIQQQLDELTVESPLDGVIEASEIQPGDLVAANAPILSILDLSHLWVRAYVPENHLDLRTGQSVWVTTDSFPKRRFKGTISFVAREAEFTPNNVQTPEERSKQVFRIKVDLAEGLDVLRAGMSADVWLE